MSRAQTRPIRRLRCVQCWRWYSAPCCLPPTFYCALRCAERAQERAA